VSTIAAVVLFWPPVESKLQMSSVLVVDDSPSVRALLKDYLVGQGMAVDSAPNGREGLMAARRDRPDVILLDVAMPEMDGYEFLRQYRRESRTPVLIITAREDEADAVLGLELGADDYVVKPFRMRELVARIRAAIRRASADQGEAQLRGGDIVLDPTSYAVTVRGEPVALTPLEFGLLRMLMSAPGRVLSREQISDRLGEEGFTGLERTLNVHVRNLRAKVELDPAQPTHVETVFGVGYRFHRFPE
jgi:two-component system alkaline phosphatase synthesis response regulator PhoP